MTEKERQIKFALPNKGWLVREDRWTLRNILVFAGLAESGETKSEFYYRSLDPEIDFSNIRGRDIPEELFAGNYDLGLTGADLVLEAFGNDFRCKISDEMDLGCNYADLFIMTMPETLEKLKSTPGYRYCDDARFIVKELNRLSPPVRIATAYPNALDFLINLPHIHSGIFPRGQEKTAKRIGRLMDKQYSEKIQIIKKHGALEELLVKNKGRDFDFIFETMASGISSRDKGVVSIGEPIVSSTLHLYSPPAGTYGDQETFDWVRNKVDEIKDKLRGVQDIVNTYCQVDLFNLPEGWRDIHSFIEKVPASSSRAKFRLDGEIPFDETTSPHGETHVVIPKEKISELQGLLVGTKKETYGPTTAKCYNLSNLYAYCPVEVNGGALPCASTLWLRPEHVGDAMMFEFDGDKFLENPKYSK